MEVPERIAEIIRDATLESVDDVEAAVEEALKQIKREKNWKQWLPLLARLGVQRLVWGERHRMNVQLKGQLQDREPKPEGNGEAAFLANGKPKVLAGQCVSDTAHRAYMSYFIDGRVLGDILGSELGDIAENEQARANGSAFRAELCRELGRKVKKDKRVRDCLTDSQLERVFRAVEGRKVQATAAVSPKKKEPKPEAVVR